MKRLALLFALAVGLLSIFLLFDRGSGGETVERDVEELPVSSIQAPLTTASGRRRNEGLDAAGSPSEAIVVNGETAATLTVSSSHGLSLTRAFVRTHGESKWRTVPCSADGRIPHPGRADVKGPGHVASHVGETDKTVALVADGLLVLTAIGLRAATFETKDGNLWVGAGEHASMSRATSAGFIGPDQFAVAVTPRDWPNHNQRPLFDLALVGGPIVSVSFLPDAGERAHVDVVLEPDWCRDTRSELTIEIDPSELDANDSVALQIRPFDDAEDYLIDERGPWGSVQAQMRWESSELSGDAPGPWTFEHVMGGASYRASATTGTGRYGVLEFVHDGRARTLSLSDPSHVVGRLVGSNGESIETADFNWRFDAVENAPPGSSEWNSSTTASKALPLESGRFDIRFPRRVPITLDAASQMPDRVALTVHAQGYEIHTREVSLHPGRTTDLGDVLLPARKLAFVLTSPPELELGWQPLVEWKQGPDQISIKAGFERVIDASTGDWRVYLTTAADFEAAPPEFPVPPPGALFLTLGRDAVGGLLTDSGKYNVVPPTRRQYAVEIGPFDDPVPSQVGLAVSWRGFRRMMNTFWPDAFGTTRTLAWHMPEGELTYWWRRGKGAEWEALPVVAGDQAADGVLKLTP